MPRLRSATHQSNPHCPQFLERRCNRGGLLPLPAMYNSPACLPLLLLSVFVHPIRVECFQCALL